MDGGNILESGFSLGWVNVKVHQGGIYLQKEGCHRMTSIGKIAGGPVVNGLHEAIFSDFPSVYVDINQFLVVSGNGRLTDDDGKLPILLRKLLGFRGAVDFVKELWGFLEA